jgi:hypothetical protein
MEKDGLDGEKAMEKGFGLERKPRKKEGKWDMMGDRMRDGLKDGMEISLP